MRIRFLPVLLLLIITSPALAEQQFGFAMHGEPKYTAESKNVEYANPESPKGGAITHAAIGTFDTLNPYSIKGKAAKGLNLYYDRLMGRVWDEPFTLYPLIAKSYEVAEDRSSISFTLNPEAKFNDGTPITAEDVIFSYQTLRDHGRPNMRNVYKIVKSVGQKEDGSIHFTFNENYDQETAMILAMMPVLSKKWWDGKDFEATTLEIPLSSGPYTISDVGPGRSITYERNSDYWAKDLLTNAGHYNFDTITHEYFRDNGVAFESFKSGDISIRLEQDSTRWHKGYNISSSRQKNLTKEEIEHSRPERTRGMIFNTRREPFNNINVRHAMSMVLDFDSMNKILFNNDYKQINSFYPNSELSYLRKEEEKEKFNLRARTKEAGELLTKSGWDVVNGKRIKDGKPFEFEIILSAPEDEKVALHYKKALDRLGITMNIRVMDSAAFIDRLHNYDYDMVLYFWNSSLSPGTEQVIYWGCDAAEQKGRFNYAGICDTEVERLVKRVAQTKSRKKLVETMQTLDRLLVAGHYMIPLHYAGYDRYAYWKPVTRPETTPIYGAVLETWWDSSIQLAEEKAEPEQVTEDTKPAEIEETEDFEDIEDFSELIILEMLDELRALEKTDPKNLVPDEMKIQESSEEVPNEMPKETPKAGTPEKTEETKNPPKEEKTGMDKSPSYN
ncbi:extracellular solute-binding protein [Alphaproteobacteria bacterium]|nr:extracellular solute-binding protein [Alphaproteobacteria bacterium]